MLAMGWRGSATHWQRYQTAYLLLAGLATPLVVSVHSILSISAGCHRDMHDQPRYDPLEPSAFFANGMSARHPVPGTIARGQLQENEAWHSGRAAGQLVAQPPVEISRELLERGQQRYNIFCSVCHAPTGEGNGMVVRRGMKQPPSLHSDRLRNAPAGHFFDVITNGFGAMPHYQHQLPPADRWADIAYIRALQMSRHATLDYVPEAERAKLGEAVP
jgi:mono/diheme cytochrome c family protein